jgi:hypothetical protein
MAIRGQSFEERNKANEVHGKTVPVHKDNAPTQPPPKPVKNYPGKLNAPMGH